MEIEDVFSMLAAMYGSRLSQMWKDCDPMTVKSVWSSRLKGQDEVDIGAALEACMTALPSYPPTLPEFLGLCRDARSKRTAKVQKITGPREAPDPAAMAKIHSIVGRLAAKWRVG